METEKVEMTSKNCIKNNKQIFSILAPKTKKYNICIYILRYAVLTPIQKHLFDISVI